MIGIALSMAGNPSQVTAIQQAIAVLRKFGTDAHIYLPGVGMLNGLTAANYLDSAGTTQGTVDQPVGLVLDAAGSLGVELVTNPTFSSGGAGWAVSFWTLSTGSASCASLAGGNLVYQTGLLSSGKVYQFTYTVSSVTLGGVCAYANGNQGPTRTVAGTYTETLSAAAANNFLAISTVGTTTATVTNISVREVTGIHASQPTTASKPILRRGAVNLLTYSGDFSNAAWTAANITEAAGQADPYGGTGATKLVSTATTNGMYERQAFPFSANTKYTVAAIVKASGYNYAYLMGYDGSDKGAVFSLTDGSSTVQYGGAIASSTDIGGGYFLCVVAFTTGVSPTVNIVDVRIQTTNASGNITGDGISGITLYRAALFQGTYTAAQIQALGGIPLTTTAPASTTLGPQYWQFDGSNDSLSLGGPLFQMADDHWVVSVFSVASVTSQVVASPSGKSGSYVKAATLITATTTGNVAARWTSDAAVDYSLLSNVSALGVVQVASVVKRANIGYLRVAGLQKSSIDLSACTIASLDVGNIGKEAQGANVNGSIYPMAFGKGTMTDADLLLIEKALGQIAGVQI